MHYREDGFVPAVREFEDHRAAFTGRLYLPEGTSLEDSPFWRASEEDGQVTELSLSFAGPRSDTVTVVVVSQACRRAHPLAPVSTEEMHRFELAQHLTYFITNHGAYAEQDALAVDAALEGASPMAAALRVDGRDALSVMLVYGAYRAIATVAVPFVVIVGTADHVEQVAASGVFLAEA